MLRIDNISCNSSRRIHNFTYVQEKGTTQTLFSPDINFLNDFLSILEKKMPINAGNISIDQIPIGSHAFRRQCQMLVRKTYLYPDLTVKQNVFFDKRLCQVRKLEEAFRSLLNETGFEIDPNKKVGTLDTESKKIVEILKIYYMKPKLLVLRELSGALSIEHFLKLKNVLKLMNREGATCLYLANQLEEVLRIGSNVAIVSNGINKGTYAIEEIEQEPEKLIALGLNVQQFQKKESDSSGRESFFKAFNESIKQASKNSDIRSVIESFSKYILRELGADSIISYILYKRQNRMLQIYTSNETEECSQQQIERIRIKPNVIQCLMQEKHVVFLSRDEHLFSSTFCGDPTDVNSVICYGLDANKDSAVFLQINYRQTFLYSANTTLIVEWAAREMAVFIENSQLMDKSILLRESYHRIKNNLQVIVSLLEMEKLALMDKNEESQRAIDAFDSAISRVGCIAKMHELLSHDTVRNDICDINKIIYEVANAYKQNADIRLTIEKIYIPYAKTVSIALVINEIITNSIKHSGNKNGQVKIQICIETKTIQEQEYLSIIVKDNGKGYPLKANGALESEGVGMSVIRSIVLIEMEGTLNCYNKGGAVTEISMLLKSLMPI